MTSFRKLIVVLIVVGSVLLAPLFSGGVSAEENLVYPESCLSMLGGSSFNEISLPSTTFAMAGDGGGTVAASHLGCVSFRPVTRCASERVESLRVSFTVDGLLSEREDADGLWGYVTRGSTLNGAEDLLPLENISGVSVGYDGIGWGSGSSSQERIWYSGEGSFDVKLAGMSLEEIAAIKINFLWSDDHQNVPRHDVSVNDISLVARYTGAEQCDVSTTTVGVPKTGSFNNSGWVATILAVSIAGALSVVVAKRNKI
jgi:hypothetical protein